MKTLIVDDEPIARRVLAEELEAFPEVTVLGEASNGREALLKITELQPDVVFLDLQMPVMSGFEVIQNLQRRAGTRGRDCHRVRPACHPRLRSRRDRLPAQTGECFAATKGRRAREIFAAESSGGGERSGENRFHGQRVESGPSRKIVGRVGDEYHVLDADDVLAFQAERELVWIVTAKQRLLATQPLHAIEERLAGTQFRRVHRNAIVNVNHVRKMSALSSERWLVTLSNSLQLTVSKRLARTIREILRW